MHVLSIFSNHLPQLHLTLPPCISWLALSTRISLKKALQNLKTFTLISYMNFPHVQRLLPLWCLSWSWKKTIAEILEFHYIFIKNQTPPTFLLIFFHVPKEPLSVTLTMIISVSIPVSNPLVFLSIRALQVAWSHLLPEQCSSTLPQH